MFPAAAHRVAASASGLLNFIKKTLGLCPNPRKGHGLRSASVGAKRSFTEASAPLDPFAAA